MLYTIKEKARYLAKAVMEAIKGDRNLEEAIEEALQNINRDEKGSGVSGL